MEDIVPKDDDPILDTIPEEIFKEEVVDFKEPPIEIEIVEFDLEDITPEDVVEIPIQDEVVEDELDKEIPKDDFESEKEIKEEVKEPEPEPETKKEEESAAE